ncbi:MAG: SpoVR family protein [Planctomycetes bacterium]|nr:SpoVR family protein [Planctomycetota bacterium]
MNLTADLERARAEIERHARDFGLDFFPTVFELVDHDELNEVAAFGGFPTRYPHWRFGMEFDRLQKGYRYGISKIYELVINNDPCFAYLMKSNSLVDQKLVMAHVYGHCDFFKNNVYFAHTDRKMVDRMANHGTILRRLMERHGVTEVETFLDRCLALDNLIDPHSMALCRTPIVPRTDPDQGAPASPAKLKAKSYMDRFVNPPHYLEQQRREETERHERAERLPARPQRDVLRFLLDHAPLKRWQQEVLSLVREEAYYFAPQAQTKIMNEGWASYWHSTIMTQRVLRDSELVDFADHHAGTLATSPGRLNPYKLGIELYRSIEDRWNKGRFGKQWDDCESLAERRRYDRKLDLGTAKIFEVHRLHCDVTFVDTFLDQDFCDAQKMYVYRTNPRTGRPEVASRDHKLVKEQLLFGLSNSGQPIIEVVDGNHDNRGELRLAHRFEGLEIDMKFAGETLKLLEAIWARPVCIESKLDGKGTLVRCEKGEVSTRELAPSGATDRKADAR